MIKGKLNADDVLKNFKDTLDLSKNFKPLMLLMLGKGFDTSAQNAWTLRGSVMNAFATKTNPINKTGWGALTKDYFNIKQKKFPGLPSLVRTRLLLDTLQSNPGTYSNKFGDSGAAVVVMTNTQLQYGTTVPYAGYLQGGTKYMLSRGYMGLNSANRTLFRTLISRYVKQTMMGQKPDGKAE